MRYLFALLVFFVGAAAHADVRARIAAADPATEASFGREQTFYVRIQFDADEEVSFWARPYLRGKRLDKGYRSNASARHSGSGNALGWFSFDGVAEVDEVRIVAGGGKPYRETEVAALPVKLSWTGQPHPPLARAQWVADLQGETARAWRAERAAENAKPPNPLAAMFMSGFMLLVLALLVGSVAAPLWGLWKWRGGWRVLPAVPLALMGFVIGRIVVDVARDPTSHNLWPFEILMFGTASIGVMLVLAFVRRLTGAASSSV